MKAKKVVKNARYWRSVFELEARALTDCRRDLDVARNKIHAVINDANQLREDNKLLLNRITAMKDRPIRTVDPTAEVVMNMKKATEFAINTSAALLDAMGELVDAVSGRKERREIERRDGIEIPQ
jgi:hypothetical protein